VVVTGRVKVVQRACLVIVATLIAASCGSGTESTRETQSDGRNVALPDQDGLPYLGISNNLSSVAVNPTGRGAWVGGGDVSVGQVTGGAMVLQAPDYSTLDPIFPRIEGFVDSVVHDPVTNEFAVAGDYVVSRPNVGGDLLIFTPNGIRQLQGTINGQILSMGILARTLYTAGTSTGVVDAATNRLINTTGLHRFDMTTGAVLAQPQLEGLSATAFPMSITVGRFSTNRSLAIAAVIRDATKDQPYSLKIFNAQTGAVLKTLKVDQPYIKMQTVENGYALVEIPGEAISLLEVDTGLFIANYAAPDLVINAAAGSGRIRIMKIDPATRLTQLVDLNKRTLAEVSSIELPPTLAAGNILWAGPNESLIGGQLFHHDTRTTDRIITRDPGHLATTSVGPRGVFLGGMGIKTFGNANRGSALRIPDDLALKGISGFGSGKVYSVAGMTTTPKGVVAIVNAGSAAGQVMLFGPDPSVEPVVIATFTRDGPCRAEVSYYDIESTGSSVLLTGCWNRFDVANTSTANKVVELDLSGPSPVLARSYFTAVRTPRQVTATDRYVYVTFSGADPELRIFDRASRVAQRSIDYNNDIADMVAFTETNGAGQAADVDVLVAVGQNIKERNTGNGGPILLHSIPRDDLWNISMNSKTDFRGGGVSVALVDTRSQGGSDYAVYVGGYFTDVNLALRGVLRWSVQSEELTALNLYTDQSIEDITVEGDRLWMVGGFAQVTTNSGFFRASGVAAYDLTSRAVMLRGTGVTPTTVDPSAPGTGSSDPLSGPPVGPTPPPELPNTGDAAPGVYSTVSASGMRVNVEVGADGTITIIPEVGSTPIGRPYIVKLKPGSRNVRVSWRSTTNKAVYKVTTGRGKGKRTCTSTRTWCTVKKLDPWKAHTFTVEARTGRRTVLSEPSPRIKPHVTVRKGSSTKASTIAPKGAKGKTTWTTTGPCSVKAGRLIAPKKAARCVLTVTTGKSTRKVTVVVS